MDYYALLTGVIAGTTALWTIFQEMRISKICQRCPYFPPNKK